MPLLTLHCQVGTDIYQAGTDPGPLVGGCIPNPDAWDNAQPYGGYPENPDCPEHWQSIGHYTDPNAGSSSADLAALEARVDVVEALPVRTGHRHVVADIASRDDLQLGTQDPPLEVGDEALVIDASADPTVDAGRASYIWDGTTWLKDAEQESLDLGATTVSHQLFNNPNLGSMNNPGVPANGVPQERHAFSYTPTTDEQIEVTVFGQASAGTLGFQIGTTALDSDVFFPAAADRVTTTADTHTETLTLTAGVEVFFSVFAGGGGIIQRSGLSVRAIQSGDIVLPDMTTTTYAVPVDATLALVNEYRPANSIEINNTLFTTGFDFSQVDVIEFVLRDSTGNFRQWATQALDAKEFLAARTAFLHVFSTGYCIASLDNAGDETTGTIRMVDANRQMDLVAIRFLSYVPSGEGKRRVSFFDAGNTPINTTTFVTGIDLTSVDTVEFNIRDDINNFRQWPISSLDAAQLVEIGEAYIHTYDNDFVVVTVVDATTGEISLIDNGRPVTLVDVSGFVFGNLEAPEYKTDTTLFFEGFNLVAANAVRQEYVDGFLVTVLEDASASFANYNLDTNLPLTRPITHRVKVLRDSVTPGADLYFRYAWPSNIAAVRVDMAAGTAVTEGNRAGRVTIDNLVVTEKWIEVTATWSADARWEVFSFHPGSGGTAASVGVNRIIDIGYDIEPTPPATSATAAFTHTRTSTGAETVNIPAGFTNPIVCANSDVGDVRISNVTTTSFDVAVFDTAGNPQAGVLQVQIVEATS